jgi:hypothetical protein
MRMSNDPRPVSGISAPAPRMTRMGALVLAIVIAAPVWAVLTAGEIIWRLLAP